MQQHKWFDATDIAVILVAIALIVIACKSRGVF